MGRSVKKLSEYRQHASECRSLAATMPSDDQREQLLAMAETWDRLAEERERSATLVEAASFNPADEA